MAIDTVTVESRTGEAAVCGTGFETEDGHLIRADETMTRWSTVGRRGGSDLTLRPNPMLGVPLRLTRQPDGIWTAHLRDAVQTPEQERSLYGAYTFDLAPGDAWDAPADVLDARMGPLDPATPSSYHIRLDSLAGGLAYLTHDADLATAPGDEHSRTLLRRHSVVDVADRGRRRDRPHPGV